MERKIGEIFEYNGKWYQAVKSQGKCHSCDLFIDGHCVSDFSLNGSCFYCHRKDGENVMFRELEKVGEPVIVEGRTFQCFIGFYVSCEGCVFNTGKNPCDKHHYIEGPCPNNEIWVEIKQNEKDMEGKVIEDIKVGNKVICLSNNKPYFITETNCRMKYNGNWHDCVIYTPFYDNPYKCFVRPIEDFAQNFVLDSAKEEKHSNLESAGKKLKPFNLEAAKAGKPVCTRDGRNVRIICFDCKIESFPIVALVSGALGREEIISYDEAGYSSTREPDDRLFMLPEKKIGWINAYNKLIYNSEEDARDGITDDSDYVGTIKVEWEE